VGFAVKILVPPGVKGILLRGKTEKVDFSVDFFYPGNATGGGSNLFKAEFHGNASLSVCLLPLYSEGMKM
jgi:hypothetical protein